MMGRHSVRRPSLEQDWPSQSTQVETCGRRCKGEAEKIINIPRHQQDAGLEPVHVGFFETQRYIQYGCGLFFDSSGLELTLGMASREDV